MLGKLIKYEFKATGRTMLLLIAAVLVLAALSGMSVILLDRETSYGILQAIFVLILIAFFACIFALGVMALAMMIERFYKNLLGSEGYLMFTLPVSTSSLIASKALSLSFKEKLEIVKILDRIGVGSIEVEGIESSKVDS